MRSREIQSWQKIGASLAGIAESLHASPPSWAVRLRPMLDWLPFAPDSASAQESVDASSPRVQVGGSPEVSTPVGSRSGESGSASHKDVPLPAPGRAVSLFAVDPTKVTAGTFFHNLSFQRNDPTREAPVVFEQAPARAGVETCRQFFAYSIPWAERGGAISGPTDSVTLGVPAGFQSLGLLSAAATAQALHLASKMKREKNLIAAYTSEPGASSPGRASEFFGAVPWSARRSHPTHESNIGLQA